MNQPNPSQPQEQQPLAVLVLTGQEVTLAHQALGELPARLSEGLRGKIASQAQNQSAVLAELQTLLAQQNGGAPKSDDAPAANNVRQIENRKTAAPAATAPESATEPPVAEAE